MRADLPLIGARPTAHGEVMAAKVAGWLKGAFSDGRP